ncbi:hypothetical protein VTO73DRAFT_4350 [Trametes versicolor]
MDSSASVSFGDRQTRSSDAAALTPRSLTVCRCALSNRFAQHSTRQDSHKLLRQPEYVADKSAHITSHASIDALNIFIILVHACRGLWIESDQPGVRRTRIGLEDPAPDTPARWYRHDTPRPLRPCGLATYSAHNVSHPSYSRLGDPTILAPCRIARTDGTNDGLERLCDIITARRLTLHGQRARLLDHARARTCCKDTRLVLGHVVAAVHAPVDVLERAIPCSTCRLYAVTSGHRGNVLIASLPRRAASPEYIPAGPSRKATSSHAHWAASDARADVSRRRFQARSPPRLRHEDGKLRRFLSHTRTPILRGFCSAA